MLAEDAWPILASAAATCLLAAAWLLARGRRNGDADPAAIRPPARDGRPGRGARMRAALRLPALAAFGAFTVSAALDGIAALLPPEVPPLQAQRDCAEPHAAGDGAASCEAGTAPRPRH